MTQLQTTLRQLRLSGLSQTLDVRLHEAADFRTLMSLEDFNGLFNAAMSRKQNFDLAAGNYLREGKDILCLGPPAWASRCAAL